MKEILKLKYKSTKNIDFFFNELNENLSFEKWAFGSFPAYSLTPFYSEILGNKPAKFLKKTSTKGKNKQIIYYNSNSEIIGQIHYLEFSKFNKEWIVSRKFYEKENDNLIEYSFGSCLESRKDATIQSIKYADCQDGKIHNVYSLTKDEKYSIISLEYGNNNITFLNQKMWLPFYVERNYKIQQVNNEIVIVDELLENGKTERIM